MLLILHEFFIGLIDYIVFYATSAIFWPYKGSSPKGDIGSGSIFFLCNVIYYYKLLELLYV